MSRGSRRRPSGRPAHRSPNQAASAKGLEAPPRPTITLETVDARGLAELLREPDVAGVARPMPLALIEPLSASSPTPAWGIDAVGAARSAFTGAGTVVAVLDTGINPAHRAFAGVRLVVEASPGTGPRIAMGTARTSPRRSSAETSPANASALHAA